MDRVDIGLLFSTPEGKRSLAQLETAPTIAAAGALALGAALCTLGARFRRHAALGCAFLDGAVALSLTLSELHVLRASGGDWASAASWACFVLGGVLLCVLVVANDVFGHFVVGATAGAMLALACHTSFGFRVDRAHPWVPLIVLLSVLSLAAGLLTVRHPRAGMIGATSWVGASAMTWGSGYFLGDYPNGAALAKYRSRSGAYAIPSAWWGYLAATIVCCVLGCALQHCAGTRKREPVFAHHRRLRVRRQQRRQRQPHSGYECTATPRLAQTRAARDIV